MKHTPGPWNTMLNTRPGAGYIAIERAGTEFAIARVPLSANGWHDEQSKANAALIAAAPELLEALKACKVLYCDYAKERHPIHEQIEAAIAKAQGEQ